MLEVAVGARQTIVRLVSGRPVQVESPAGSGLLRSTMTLPTRRPDRSATTNLARCRPATADPATAEPAEAADDGTVTTQWIGETAAARVTVDLGRIQQVGAVTLSRNALTTYPAPPGGDKGVTRPTVSADARVQVSVDGSTWRTLGIVDGKRLEARIASDGRPVRFARLVAVGATENVPLIVGELALTRATN